MPTMAHNTERSGTKRNVPVIVEDDTLIPADERHDWHEATDEEYEAYEAYWQGKNAAQDALEAGRVPGGERIEFRAFREGNRHDWSRPWRISATHQNADSETTWAQLPTVSEAVQYINGARDGHDELRSAA